MANKDVEIAGTTQKANLFKLGKSLLNMLPKMVGAVWLHKNIFYI